MKSIKKLYKYIAKLFTNNWVDIVDAEDIIKGENVKLYIGADGKMYFQSVHQHGEVLGFCEWPTYTKFLCEIEKSTIVLDTLIKPIEITE